MASKISTGYVSNIKLAYGEKKTVEIKFSFKFPGDDEKDPIISNGTVNVSSLCENGEIQKINNINVKFNEEYFEFEEMLYAKKNLPYLYELFNIRLDLIRRTNDMEKIQVEYNINKKLANKNTDTKRLKTEIEDMLNIIQLGIIKHTSQLETLSSEIETLTNNPKDFEEGNKILTSLESELIHLKNTIPNTNKYNKEDLKLLRKEREGLKNRYNIVISNIEELKIKVIAIDKDSKEYLEKTKLIEELKLRLKEINNVSNKEAVVVIEVKSHVTTDQKTENTVQTWLCRHKTLGVVLCSILFLIILLFLFFLIRKRLGVENQTILV